MKVIVSRHVLSSSIGLLMITWRWHKINRYTTSKLFINSSSAVCLHHHGYNSIYSWRFFIQLFSQVYMITFVFVFEWGGLGNFELFLWESLNIIKTVTDITEKTVHHPAHTPDCLQHSNLRKALCVHLRDHRVIDEELKCPLSDFIEPVGLNY